jgi:disulfide bond formation protein DsbB
MLLAGGCGGSSTPPDPGVPDARAGEVVYGTACIACHAADGEGIPGLGKPLANSEFIAGMTDDELARFIVVGRGTTDPENTSGIAMPPRGGRPNLSDADVYDVVAYLRTLQDAGN